MTTTSSFVIYREQPCRFSNLANLGQSLFYKLAVFNRRFIRKIYCSNFGGQVPNIKLGGLYMRKNFYKHTLPAVLFLMVFFAVGMTQVSAATIYGVTGTNQLVKFGAASPGTVTTVGPITGLTGGDNIIGIDFRPKTGQLYALGSGSRLYTINKTTGAATFVATLSVPLSGTNFGFDFNPVADRIRIISDTDQNLRVNPTNGMTIVDGTLQYSAGDPNVGTSPTATGAAYTGSFVGTTTTALYDIDTNLNILVTQNPANSGMLQTVGPLGFDPPDVLGFDHTAASNIAYASWTAGGTTRLYTVNLTTGAAANLGPIGAGVTDITVEIGSVQAITAWGLTNNNQLVRFNTQNPNAATTMPITGLPAGVTLTGIDFRPATGQLYAYGTDPTGLVTRALYTINLMTGAATFVANVDAPIMATGSFGFDFNPTVDRIRIVNTLDENRRANPTTGATIIDGTLAYATGDPNAGANPNIVAAGYTNSFGGATSTALYDIDSNLDILAQQNPANVGTLQTIGGLTWNTTDNAGLDIIRGSNTAIASLELVVGGNPAGNSGLYQVDLNTGTAAFVAPINSTVPIISVTVGGDALSRVLDFDGDGITCYTVFRPSNNTWYIRSSVDGSTKAVAFGTTATDVFTPGDYDGDGKTDISVWRTTNQTFFTLRSSDNAFVALQYGAPNDEPVSRDYDGDGITDYAVVRRTNGQMIWYYRSSITGNTVGAQFGADTDIVAPGDYDGDGRFDLAVRRGTGSQAATFYIQQSTAGFRAVTWGAGGDIVAPGDYDGDGKTDFTAVRQGSTYFWYILRSSDNGVDVLRWGAKPMFTAQGDYDGDGKTDVTVWDPTTGTFYVKPVVGNFFQFQWGQNGDVPVASYDTH